MYFIRARKSLQGKHLYFANIHRSFTWSLRMNPSGTSCRTTFPTAPPTPATPGKRPAGSPHQQAPCQRRQRPANTLQATPAVSAPRASPVSRQRPVNTLQAAPSQQRPTSSAPPAAPTNNARLTAVTLAVFETATARAQIVGAHVLHRAIFVIEHGASRELFIELLGRPTVVFP